MKRIQKLAKLFPSSQGFTLIELLTVIAIIGILTGLLTVSFIGVRQRGRDAQRKSDVRQVQSAVELYKADNDSYPAAAILSTCNAVFNYNSVTYMAKIPCDPSANTAYYYYSPSGGASYAIASCIENTGDKSAYNGAAARPASTVWPSAAAWPPLNSTICPTQYFFLAQNP